MMRMKITTMIIITTMTIQKAALADIVTIMRIQERLRSMALVHTSM